ncbi:putative E3 ubiquitin-protein ligase SH3RF2 isoform X1 [Arapaima gigas]
MEDLAMLDLLECPLCFEPLDRLAVSSAGLRCPECRVPVSEGVEELPTNLLLVRLLEGLRQGPVGTARHGTLRYGVPPGQGLSVRRSKEVRYSTLRQTQGRKKHLDGASIQSAVY